MNTRVLMPCNLFAALLISACSGSEELDVTTEAVEVARCGPLPDSVEQQFDAMRGPLGCEASDTPVGSPPGGCAGADELLASARLEYARLWARGGCSGQPPDLAPFATAYDRLFSMRHEFVRHRIDRDGFAIAAREFGAAHASRGPLILLMHGFPDNQHLYDLVAPELARNHHVVTFDFVGWGDSSKPPAGHVFTFDGLREDLEAVLAHFAPDQVVPVVHDASGWPGIDWALDYPESVAALVLLNTAYHPIEGSAPPNVIRALSALDLRPRFIESVGDDALLNRALFRAQVSRFFTGESRKPVYLPLFEHDLLAARPGLFGLTQTLFETVVARAANVPRMAAFSRPVTVAFGADDPYLNATVARAFGAAFPTSRLELIPNAGHYVQLDRPRAIANLIAAAAARGAR